MLIKDHARKVVEGEPRSVVVSRLSIWETAKPYFVRERFLQKKGILRVTFATFESQEDAIDHGGPRREFFHLLLGAISKESATLLGMSVVAYLRYNSVVHCSNYYHLQAAVTIFFHFRKIILILLYPGGNKRVFGIFFCWSAK